MNYNYEEAKERIANYFLELVSDLNENDKESYLRQTLPSIVDLLTPYAYENNYWWEERSIKMAYYQLRHNDLVVNYNDFTKYYKELMGKEYNAMDFNTPQKRQKMIEEATIKYNAKKGKKR